MVLFKSINRLLHYICGDGSWRLLGHEEAMVNACIESLPDSAAQSVKRQLKSGFFVERIPDGRVNRIFPRRKDRAMAIELPGFEDCLYKVRFETDGEKMTGHVTFYDGFIYSVEFKKPKKYFKNKAINILRVSKGRSKDSVAEILDRAEHGRETETNP
ncbi:MAG: hypothetical protein AAFR03_06170 [Pseudomonadota bacterium]